MSHKLSLKEQKELQIKKRSKNKIVKSSLVGAILTVGDSCATAAVCGLDPCRVHALPPHGPLWWPPFHHLSSCMDGKPPSLGPLQCPLPLLSSYQWQAVAHLEALQLRGLSLV